MPLSIKILKKVGSRSDMIASRSWPQSKITIGRGEECTLVLEDPKKHVSRVHVELEEKDEGTFRVTVISKVNPVFVNGKRQAPGSYLDLHAGDRFELGEYELELLAPATAGRTIFPTLEVEETTRPNNPMLQVPKGGAAPRPEKTVPVDALDAEAAPVSEHEPAFDTGNLPPVEPGIFDEPESATAEAPAAAPRPAPAMANEGDVFAETTYVGSAANKTATNLFDEATYVGGRPGVGGAPAAAAGAAIGKAAGEAGMRAAVDAFLTGAGLEGKKIADADIEAFLLQSGKIMRAAVEGSMALLAARATAKKELRAEDRTMVASKDNNPLKLMSDPQEALAFLFDTKDHGAGGFLDPVQAVGDAFEDLRAHEVALFAGMRAALLGAIQRFDPKTLEAELEKSAGGLGLNRKAKLWEQFAAFQQKLARDAEDDFNKVFGREFMGTYMAQVKQLRGSRQ
ncbi:MAG TPA: type VI secretion system-associated FHA domain protein TagH [Burkholderiales bacterium]|nr:type VI secretion system-associated FHA domain protein TagH [Burkholderiales bacterium]